MQTHTFDPWDAAHRLGITIIRTPLRHARAYTDGCRTIWLDSRLPYCEARCSLSHELAHVVHGHTGEQPEHVEDLIRKVTSRWLIAWPDLLGQMGEQVPIEWVADALCATPDIILDRIAYATPAEFEMLRSATCEPSGA